MAQAFDRIGRMGALAVLVACTVAGLYGHGSSNDVFAIPKGEVLTPRLGAVPADPNQVVTFSGWIDMPNGTIDVELQETIAGRTSWALIGHVSPQMPGTLVNGQHRYNWEFSGPRGTILGNAVWPDGGTVRVRVRASSANGTWTILPIRDGEGWFAYSGVLVLADSYPSPADLGAATPNYLNRKPKLSTDETFEYYSSVKTDSFGRGLPIISSLFTLADFKKRYFESARSCSGSSPESVARYFNNGDLGLGREMHCVKNGCTGETACYVKNFGGADGKPLFDNFLQAKTALLADRPFATVAMVERGEMPSGAPNKVFFVAYNNDPRARLNPADRDSAPLLMEAGLDTKAYNKSIPGNCLVCHGAASQYTPSAIKRSSYDAQVRGAFFLPFDLQSFQFFSTNASDPLSKPQQQAAFKHLNRLVYETDLSLNSDAKELLEGWYAPAWSASQFVSTFVPRGWRDPNYPEPDRNRVQIYRNVVARSCRMCHISHVDPTDFTQAGALTFGRYDHLRNNLVPAYYSLCTSHAMPNAEQALKVFWRGDGRSQFLNRFGLPGDCGVNGSGSTSSVSQALTTTAVRDIAERYAADSCGCTTPSCLSKVDAQYLREMATAAPVRSGSSDDAVTEAFRRASVCRAPVFNPTP